MKLKQKIIKVSSQKYDLLVDRIQEQIDKYDDIYLVQQIDYFNMHENDTGMCQAFILFVTK